MKKIVFLLALLAVISCQEEAKKPVDYALFSGKVTNGRGGVVRINGENFTKEIPLASDGTFSDTLRIADGPYQMFIGREYSNLYLKKGDQLSLSIDVTAFDETLKYTGVGSERNNHLVNSILVYENEEDNFALDPIPFKAKIKEHKTKIDSLLVASGVKDETFIAFCKKNAHYKYLYDLDVYPYYYNQRLKNESKEGSLPEGYLEELKTIDLDIEEDYKQSSAYKRLVMSSISDRAANAVKKDSTKVMDLVFLDEVNKIKSQVIKEDLLRNLSIAISPSNEYAKAVYEGIMKESKDEEFKRELTEKFDVLKKLVKGEPSPTFEDYENYKGGTTSLKDLEGKYAYIDVWATWCQPCLQELPYLKEVEKEYRAKNIHFVSISVDNERAHEAWKKMVAAKEMTGVQLYGGKNYRKEGGFGSSYVIDGIPRFILLDKKGNIVSADAPRPSDPRLKDLLNSLDI
ncbi:TlpA family protein disulfide reductase [Aquimarina sp. TRL1]|uniref:TlpA family protein disulfide reductase n=1 Tax=Aquimarina sp. (strain TRL1) TaxID=2736252 RepID=UPI0015898C70|nr:TlpA disulfide reductase family protein [Aquimarina sp. TRL1]QKX06589.1 TlpA family protein disulfide reductase [Aquimarina sp. TRL1]